MLCHCVEDVDVEVFRGVFAQQWLRGRTFSAREPMYFCTTCGPPAVQATLKSADKKSAKSSPGKNATAPTAGKEKSKFSLSKLFSRVTQLSKKDLAVGTSASGASGGGGANGVGSSGVATPLVRSHGRAFATTSSSFNESLSARSSPQSLSTLHGRVLSIEDEEAPVTPRTEDELFLCATCAACYCKSHAADHHYSRRRPQEGSGGGAGGAAGEDEKHSLHKYPHHSFFIGVPSYISTHPAHVMEETPWGLLFPTIVMREVESGFLDPTQEYAYFDNPDRLLDELMAHDFNPLPSGAPARSGRSGLSHTMVANTSMPSNGHHDESSLCTTSATVSHRATPETSVRVANSTPQQQQGGGAVFHRRLASPSEGAMSENPPLPSHGLIYTSQGTDRWSYMCWCARCGCRPIRLPAKHYDDSNSRQRRLRQLGQSLAILSYLCRRGVRLELPARFVTWKAEDDAAVRRQQRQQQQNLRAMERRVGRATEGIEFTASAKAAALAGEVVSVAEDESGAHDTSSETVNLTRAETDRVLSRACISGFSNPSYMCYMNAVLQCVIRCTFFARPLIQLPMSGYPGKLTKSLGLLLHQLQQQTYQDIRNGAIYPYVKSVYQHICQVSSLFELDEQQDAQELLITVLNGVADEFDKGRSAEEKRSMSRISFEGSMRSEVMCARCHNRVPRDEMFMSLSIPIKSSIEAGLQSVFTPAHLRGKDRYACERCFKRLSAAEQQAHNEEARQQAEERQRLRAEGKKVSPTSEDPARHKTANCLYQEAEVRTSITKLGGTLAIHLLRFHYDPERQDFVKVASPVSIPLTLDLASYVSTEVLEEYNTARSLRTLQGRFPTVAPSVLAEYLRKAEGNQGLATRQLLTDGHGVEENLESSVPGDALSPLLTGDGHRTWKKPPAPHERVAKAPLLPTKAGATGAGRAAKTNPVSSPAPSTPLASGPVTKKHTSSHSSGNVPDGAARRKVNGNGVDKSGAGTLAEDECSALSLDSRGQGIVQGVGVNVEDGDNANADDDVGENDSTASVVHSPAGTRVRGAAAAARKGGAKTSTAPPHRPPPDGLDTALSSFEATSNGGGLDGSPLVGGSGGNGRDGSDALHEVTASLTPQQILKLKTADFDPFGERSCPVVGGGRGERRPIGVVGGGRGLGRAAGLTRQLVGIVTHRGSLHGGHYMAYVRHLGRPEVWFRCDDEDVDIVTERTVLACAPEVYLAFYE